MKKIISSCLVGFSCRYDGNSCSNSKLIEEFKKGNLIPVCPEQLGGLTTPRQPAEIINGKVFSSKGDNLTDLYNKGTEEVMKIIEIYKVKEAILKSKSPMCGYKLIYDGKFTGNLIEGNGILSQSLLKKNIKITSID